MQVLYRQGRTMIVRRTARGPIAGKKIAAGLAKVRMMASLAANGENRARGRADDFFCDAAE